MLRTSDTIAQVERPRASRSSPLFPSGLEKTIGVIEAKRAEKKMKDDILTAIAMVSVDSVVWKLGNNVSWYDGWEWWL